MFMYEAQRAETKPPPSFTNYYVHNIIPNMNKMLTNVDENNSYRAIDAIRGMLICWHIGIGRFNNNPSSLLELRLPYNVVDMRRRPVN